MNAHYYAGLALAGAALADIGYPGAQEILTDAEDFRETIRRAFEWSQSKSPVVPLQNNAWVPFYPTHLYALTPIENLYPNEDWGRSWCYDVELGAHHLVALGVIEPRAQQADWIADHMEDVQFFRSGWFHFQDEAANKVDWFNAGGFSKVQPYYTRIGEIHALRDDVKPFIRMYFNSLMSLLNREDLSIWEHFAAGAFNKTHETSYFLHQTRLIFAQERGDELWLAPFVTNNWLHQGMHVAGENIPTTFGPVSWRMTSNVERGHVDVEIVLPVSENLKKVIMRVRHPQGKPMQSVMVTGAADYAVDLANECVRVSPREREIRLRADY